MSNDNETPNCVICMEISVTTTDCNHPLCRDCYKKMDDLPAHQRNMKKCPYCRKENPKMKDAEIELTDEQKLEHYTTLMDFYREHTTIIPKAAGGAGVYQRGGVVPLPPPHQRFDQARAPVRIPEGQGLRPEPPRPLHPLAAAAADGAAPVPAAPVQPQYLVPQGDPMNIPLNIEVNPAAIEMGIEREHRHRLITASLMGMSQGQIQAINDNPRVLGYENQPVPRGYAVWSAARKQMIKARATRITLRLEAHTAEVDVALMNMCYDVKMPASTGIRIQLGAGMKMKDVPFNCRPMDNCFGCARKTRRCCGACGDQYVCAACNVCEGNCGGNLMFQHFNWVRV
jgi:hypothetical protein